MTEIQITLELILAIIGGTFLGWHGCKLIFKIFDIMAVVKKQWSVFKELRWHIQVIKGDAQALQSSWQLLDRDLKHIDRRVEILESAPKKRKK